MNRNGDIERQGERAPMADKGASALDDAKKSALKEARDSARKVARRPHAPSPTTVVAVVMLAVGVGVIAYPTVSDWWNSYHQTRTISQYIEYVQNTDPATLKAMIDDARDYNKRLRTKTNRYNMTPEEKAEYDSLLNLMGDGVIGYVQVNAINVDYPIYHGMDDAILQVAIGHLPGSSLPVGGMGTHTVISGHRGLPSAKLFTDLNKLVEGDTFTITVLDQTVTYEVDQIRTVLPDKLSDLDIEPNADYATLLTCTPYSVNTHRLLVRGHRIDNLEGEGVLESEAVQIPRYIAIPAVAIPILFAFLVGMLVYYRVRRPDFDKDWVIGVIRERNRMRKQPSETGDER